MDSTGSQKAELVQTIQALRTAYESLDQELPFHSLKNEDLAVHPKSEYLLDLLKDIFFATRKLTGIANKLISIENKFTIVLSDEDKRYLDDIVYPRSNTIRKAYFKYHPDSWLDELLESAIDESAKKASNKIFQTISSALEYWDFTIEEDDDRRHDSFNFYGAFDIVDSNYFTPDDWKTNSDTLRPVIQGEKDPLIPKDVRKRIESTYLSFIFGNWLACCAQPRATLEYAIRSKIGRETIRKLTTENRGETNLKLLIAYVAKEEFEKLSEPMERIRTRGNAVMHPTGESRLTNPNRETALQVVKDLHFVVEVLFTKTKA